jgi:hypothetical protein
MSTTTPVPTLKRMVEIMLDTNPSWRGVQVRNSDIALTILIWQRWYNVQDTVSVERLFDLPREDNVKRVRAVFQNTEHRYLPTDPAVLIKRSIAEAYWFDALGYNLTADKWRTHHQTVKETKAPTIYVDEATAMTDEQLDTVTDLLAKGKSEFKPVVLNPSEPTPMEYTTKLRAVFLPKTYSSSSLRTGEEYEIELERLVTGQPIKMIAPIEAVYPTLQSFGKTWRVVS